MKRLFLLCLIPLLAGCFAWDMDEKPLPWYPDPPEKKPTIGTVVWYGDRQAAPQPIPATFTPPPAPAVQVQELPARAPAGNARIIDVEVQPLKPVEANPAPPAAQPRADGATEDRLASLEKRLEDLYQLILKSQEAKKRK
jgi:hypothetical protein